MIVECYHCNEELEVPDDADEDETHVCPACAKEK
jgi:formylmethanofuran dehydrogenase subunit E